MAQSYTEVVAANLRAVRARNRLSQTTVARRMKSLGFGSWSGSKVSQCENGTRAIVVAELLALACALETTLHEIVGGNVPPDLVVSFPESLWQVSGVNVRNSAYGYRDYSVTWSEDDMPVVIRSASVASHMAEDKTVQLAQIHPSRFARNAEGDPFITATMTATGGAADALTVQRSA